MSKQKNDDSFRVVSTNFETIGEPIHSPVPTTRRVSTRKRLLTKRMQEYEELRRKEELHSGRTESEEDEHKEETTDDVFVTCNPKPVSSISSKHSKEDHPTNITGEADIQREVVTPLSSNYTCSSNLIDIDKELNLNSETNISAVDNELSSESIEEITSVSYISSPSEEMKSPKVSDIACPPQIIEVEEGLKDSFVEEQNAALMLLLHE